MADRMLGNLFAALPQQHRDELISVLAETKHVRI
jgi:hypothetical protein